MQNKTLIAASVSILVLTGIAATSLTLVKADESATATQQTESAKTEQPPEMRGEMDRGEKKSDMLAEMVNEGVIDQTTADKISAWMEEKRAAFQEERAQNGEMMPDNMRGPHGPRGEMGDMRPMDGEQPALPLQSQE